MSNNYKSTFEERVGEVLESSGFEYEPFSVDYVLEKKYTPDFVLADCYVECKGYFRPGDTYKYKNIAAQLADQGIEFVFLFMSPHKKVRKGAKMTMAQWAERHVIPWFADAEEVVNYVLDN